MSILDLNQGSGLSSVAFPGGKEEQNPGGIDLNPQNLDLEIQQKESSSPIISTPVNIDLQNFQGFSFQIISIQSVKDGDAVFG